MSVRESAVETRASKEMVNCVAAAGGKSNTSASISCWPVWHRLNARGKRSPSRATICPGWAVPDAGVQRPSPCATDRSSPSGYTDSSANPPASKSTTDSSPQTVAVRTEAAPARVHKEAVDAFAMDLGSWGMLLMAVARASAEGSTRTGLLQLDSSSVQFPWPQFSSCRGCVISVWRSLPGCADLSAMAFWAAWQAAPQSRSSSRNTNNSALTFIFST